ncbi:MAG: hypothetical protein PUD59_02550 [bacterium]|nr:hypothetical protein [bacterium]
MAKKSIMNFNMVKHNLSRVLLEKKYSLSKEELDFLNTYYDSNINKVETLILEGEYVGKSYNNLMIIKGIINDEKTPKQLQKVI